MVTRDTHTHREEPHSAGHHGRLQALLVGHVGVPVALHHLVAGGVGVQVPGVGCGPPVLQLVGLGKLLALAPTVPAHGLRRGDPEVLAEVYLQPLPHSGRDGLGGAPGAPLHVLPRPPHVGSHAVLVEGGGGRDVGVLDVTLLHTQRGPGAVCHSKYYYKISNNLMSLHLLKNDPERMERKRGGCEDFSDK